jgi:hypothetical protein
MMGYTWHLSVVDAGYPRGEALIASARANIWLTSVSLDPNRWNPDTLQAGRFNFGTQEGTEIEGGPVHFGIAGALPVAGDFNGDGIDEVGVFYRGHWFIDINGNGVWDDDMGAAGLGGPSDVVVYRVEYDWGIITPLIQSVLGESVRHMSSIAVRNEPF